MPRYDLMFSVVTVNPAPSARDMNREIREIELARQDRDPVLPKPRHRTRTQILAAIAIIGAGLGTTELAQFLHI